MTACRKILTCLMLTTSFSGVCHASACGGSGVVLEPSEVHISFFYSGQRVSLRMDMPGGQDVVVKVAGPKESLDLKKKGKVAGFIWMNVGEVHLEDVPYLYFVRSSRALDEIADGGLFEREQIGYNRISFRGGEEGADLFGELVKLKEEEGLYSMVEKGVHIHSSGDGHQEAATEFTFPANVKSADYAVEVFGFRAGQGSLLGTGTVHIRPSPSVLFITTLAREHGLIYGGLAVFAAVAAGLLTGGIFSIRKRKAH